MLQDELCTHVQRHKKWLLDEPDGVKLDLWGAALQHADLRGADLRGAALQHADLRYADLRGAALQYANLRYADLQYANLRGADLRGASIKNSIGNGKEIKSAQFLEWRMTWTKTDLAIGCKQYYIEKWFEFSDEDINEMDTDALTFWVKHRGLIKLMVEESL